MNFNSNWNIKTKSTSELRQLELKYNKGLTECLVKTLDKNMRKIGVLNQEIGSIDLNKRSNINLTNSEQFQLMNKEIEILCKGIKL